MIATICHLSSRIIVLTRAQLRQLNSVVGMGTHVWLLRMGSYEFKLFLMDFYIKMILHCCFWKYLEIKDIYTHESTKQAVKNKQFCKYFDESSNYKTLNYYKHLNIKYWWHVWNIKLKLMIPVLPYLPSGVRISVNHPDWKKCSKIKSCNLCYLLLNQCWALKLSKIILRDAMDPCSIICKF